MARFCTTCGQASTDPGCRFCTGCGARLDARGGRRVVVIVAAVAALLTGGGVAWAGGAFRSAAPQPVPTTTVVAPPTTVPTPSTPNPLSTPTPAPDLVELLPEAALDSDAAAVRSALTGYYTAINDGDYDAWRAAVWPSVSRNQTRSGWLAGYRTTVDDEVQVDAISAGTSSGTVLADVTMRSRQDPADGPPSLQVGCIRWSMTIPVDVTTGTVGPAVSGATRMTAC